jgi:uncharacterized repeat protein (TIGR03803 family)
VRECTGTIQGVCHDIYPSNGGCQAPAVAELGRRCLCAVTAGRLPAQTCSTLHAFNYVDGSGPVAALIQATDGNVYGTTFVGGSGLNAFGTVYKITPAGSLTTVYDFCSLPNCSDGDFTYGGVIQGADGNFYGVATDGGTGNGGTVFVLTPGKGLTVLYNFCSQPNCGDGSTSTASPIQGTDGNFYGTTNEGGADGDGTVFKMTPGGRLVRLHSFCSESGCADGFEPFVGVIEAGDGNLYGTTSNGGVSGAGTAFRLTKSGALTTLYSFCSQPACVDGAVENGLIQGKDGYFYGTTAIGGTSQSCSGGCGLAFRLTAQGVLTPLYSFCSQGGCADGEYPEGQLVQATDGNFYGVTYQGGAQNAGTIFKLAPDGHLTALYSFCSELNCADGAYPFVSLIQDTNGKFYGVASGGGYTGGSCSFDNGCGTVFSLSVGLGPFVEPVPGMGAVGAAVRILGTNLTGVTSVTFNGTPAAFKVISKSFIRATVPDRATSGDIRVKLPSGTLTSNVVFRVRH